jgi:hypothetical protein
MLPESTNRSETVNEQEKIEELRQALFGLMKLTAAAYGHQVDRVPEYVAARYAIEHTNPLFSAEDGDNEEDFRALMHKHRRKDNEED